MKQITIILLLIFLIPNVSADPGVGLVYGTESKVVEPKEEFCIEYGLYNPFNEDSQITLKADGKISKFVTSSNSEEIPAKTLKKDAKKTKICYKAPEIRTKKCIIPFLLCKYTCDQDKKYSGEILASPKSTTENNAMGSTVGMSVGAPFELVVKCKESKYNYWPLTFLISASIILSFVFLYSKHKKEKKRQEQWKRYYEQKQQAEQNQRFDNYSNQDSYRVN